jgi:hypothetical protein
MDDNICKARYGLSYVRSICDQAGLSLLENPPDADVLAVDCYVVFRESQVRVQVKCTSQWSIGGSSLTWPVEEGWVRKWDDSLSPVYFVVVIVPNDRKLWICHDGANGTLHRSAAFWVRLVPGMTKDSIRVPKDQRLMATTMDVWHKDLLDSYRPRGAS